jgi:4-hydroxybenzoate polyprenyltransferase
MHKPIGTLLLLWPTLWGLFIAARGMPPLHVLIVFLAGTFLMRSAGCVINDYADRGFDGAVERTRDRPLATGRIAPREALLFAAILSGLAFFLVLSLNRLTLWMSIPALMLATSYPFSKRFFVIPQAWLGIAFGFGIPMAFAAIQEHVPSEAWLLCIATMFWSIAYDTEYAMVDRPDDLKIGIHSSAIFFGRWDIVAILVSYGVSIGLLFYVGQSISLGIGWNLGLLFAGLISLYHGFLIRRRERAACFRAFLHNNWWGAAVFFGLLLDLFGRL